MIGNMVERLPRPRLCWRAGAFVDLLQKELVQLSPSESAPCSGDTVRCPLCPDELQRVDSTRMARFHGPDDRFVCSGTKQLRTVMALHRCDLFFPVEQLRRLAELIGSSVGPLSCTCRLRVDKEIRFLLAGSSAETLRLAPQTPPANGRAQARVCKPFECDTCQRSTRRRCGPWWRSSPVFPTVEICLV